MKKEEKEKLKISSGKLLGMDWEILYIYGCEGGIVEGVLRECTKNVQRNVVGC